MELLQLKYFCHAAETQNFSETAKFYRVPQSNISQSIKRLETELTVPLFTRRGNRVALNQRGQDFYREISAALERIEHAKNAACGMADSGKLRIGRRIGGHVLMRVISVFQKQFPQVEVITTKLRPEPEEDDFDLILADGTDRVLNSDQFTKERLFRERLVLAVPKGLLSPGREALVEEVREQSFITLNKDSLMYRDTLAVCAEMGFVPRITLQSEGSQYIPRCVALGLGVALVPEYSWLWNVARESVELKQFGDLYREAYVYRRKNRSMPRYVDVFYDLLVEEYRRLREEKDHS